MGAQSNLIKSKPMKRSKDIYEILKKISKLPVENIETLSQRKKIEKTFSPSHDLVEDVDSSEKLLGEQDSLVETWTVIGGSGLVQLLRNAYKMMTQHQFKGDDQPRIKTM